MFYASKVEDGRVRVVMYGRVLFMTSEEFARWKSAMSIKSEQNANSKLFENTTDEQPEMARNTPKVACLVENINAPSSITRN